MVQRQQVANTAAHAVTGEGHSIDTEVIKHADDVRRILFERVAVRRVLALSGTATLHQDDLVTRFEALRHRHPVDARGGIAVVQQQRLAVTANVVEQVGAVYACVGHCWMSFL